MYWGEIVRKPSDFPRQVRQTVRPTRRELVGTLEQPSSGSGVPPESPDANAGEVGPEAQEPRTLSVPFQPTEKMIREHEISHLPYRNWCVACVRGRGRSDPHRTRSENRDEPLFPVISVDYIADQHQPILVLVDRASKSHWAHIVPQKGIGHPYPVAAVLTDLRRSGYKKVIMKSDNENSIVALITAVQKHWTGELVPEHSPAYESPK